MSMPTGIQPFRFEATYDTGDAMLQRARRERPFGGLTPDRLLVAFGIIGLALLFWIYTIALGAVILACTTFAWAMREKSRGHRERAQRFMESSEAVRVGGTESEYWIEGDGFSARGRWDRVRTSSESGDYILVRSSRMPSVYLPIAALRDAGAYDAVKAILDERHRVFAEAMGIALEPVT